MTATTPASEGSRPSGPPPGPSRAASRRALFAAFFKIGLCGFGGVSGWVRPIIVEERRWLNDLEFAELLGAASVLPGANTVNLAIMLGDRFQGASGAATAVAGLLFAPLAILVLCRLALRSVRRAARRQGGAGGRRGGDGRPRPRQRL